MALRELDEQVVKFESAAELTRRSPRSLRRRSVLSTAVRPRTEHAPPFARRHRRTSSPSTRWPHREPRDVALEALEEGCLRFLVEDFTRSTGTFPHAVRNAAYADDSAGRTCASAPPDRQASNGKSSRRIGSRNADIAHHYVQRAARFVPGSGRVRRACAADDAQRFASAKRPAGTSRPSVPRRAGVGDSRLQPARRAWANDKQIERARILRRGGARRAAMPRCSPTWWKPTARGPTASVQTDARPSRGSAARHRSCRTTSDSCEY